MKLLYIANARMPTEKAHGIQIAQMLEAFSQFEFKNQNSKIKITEQNSKFDVELVVPNRSNKIKTDIYEYYGVQKNFKITKLPCLDLVRFGKIGFLLQWTSFAKMASFYALIKKPEIIYSRDELSLFFLSFFRKGLVWEAHTAKNNFFIRRVIRRCLVVCISGGLKDYYVNQFSEISGSSESVEIRGQNLSEKILVAHDGVDIAKFDIEVSKIDARKKTNLPQDKKIICYIGSSKTMGIEKGIDDAIQSLKHLDDEFVLVLVGIDEKSFESNDAALLRFLKNRVIFTGRVLREDVPLYLKASDVLIAPFPDKEHYMYYMSPLKIFEYMVSLRPIVVSLLPSVREVLSDKNSILVKPGDSGRLAMGIYKAVYEEDLADKISKQARSDVENYTWTKRAGKIMEFIASHK